MSLVPSRRSFLAGLGSLLAAPALVRADNLMPVRSIARLLLPSYHYDSFDNLKPAGIEYQWISKLVMGEDTGHVAIMQGRGWSPVPASRFKSKFATNGTQIEYGDCVLMERSQSLCDAARQVQIAASRRLISDWVDRNEARGWEVSIRETAGPVEFTTVHKMKEIT